MTNLGLSIDSKNNMTKPFTGGKFFLWMLGFFGVIFAVNIFFVTVALKSNSGVVDTRYYEHGVKYNEILAQSDFQKSLGWTGVLNRTGAVIQFKLVDRHGLPVAGKAVTLSMRRPAQAGQDFDIQLTEQSPGVYIGELHNRPLGIWNGYFHTEWKEGETLHEYDQVEPIELTQ